MLPETRKFDSMSIKRFQEMISLLLVLTVRHDRHEVGDAVVEAKTELTESVDEVGVREQEAGDMRAMSVIQNTACRRGTAGMCTKIEACRWSRHSE